LTPTRRAGLVLGVLAVVALALQNAWGIAIVVGALVVGATVADGVAARYRSVGVRRSRVGTLARGTEVDFEIAVDAGGTGRLLVHQPVPPELLLRPADSTGNLEGRLVGRHRGRHTLGRTSVRVFGPLGLSGCDRALGQPIEVVVMPDLPGARRMAEARARGRLADAGRVRSRLGLGTEFETIREYSTDDDVRQINWLASSRVGRPMSNQYRIDENRDLVCLLDSGRLMAAPLGSATRMDIALDALAALAVAADDAGDRVGVTAFAAAILRELRPRRRGAEGVVRALFDLEPVEVDSDYQFAFTAAARSKRALITLFTDLMDEEATSSLIEALPMLVRKHAVMAVSCIDTDLEAVVRTQPVGVDDMLRQSVAIDLLAASARSASLIRRMGAVVVEESPSRLGEACVEGYLRLKRRALL
jgi:uncharacterized protein (DUF58 family)